MNRFRNIGLGKKIAFVFGGSALLVICLAGLALWSLQAIQTAMRVSESQSHMMTLAESISANQGAIAQRVATMTIGKRADQETMAQLLAIRSRYMGTFDELRSLAVTEQGKPLLGQAEQAAAQWREADNRLIALLKDGKPAEAASFHQQVVVPRFRELGVTIADYVRHREQRLAEINAQTEARIAQVTFVLISLGAVSLLVAIVLCVVLTRSIARPLAAAVAHLGEVAGGDLSCDMPVEYLERGDESGLLSKAVQAMSASLRDVL